MADETLSQNAKKVYEAMKKLGATSEDKMKTADDIMKAAGIGKGIVNNALQELQNKGYVKRVARQKSAGYYILK
ncbi:MAG: helix-turn-helix domain-containing protein [Thermoplasmata archaeon]|jgi:predicted transcriptional regulator